MAWQKEGNNWLHRRRGGAWLLAEIINDALSATKFRKAIRRPIAETFNPEKNDVSDLALEEFLPGGYLSSAAILGLYPYSATRRSSDKKQVYRIDKFLGWLHNERSTISETYDTYKRRLNECLAPYLTAQATRDIIALHDRDGHFRRLEHETLRKLIGGHFQKDRTWIVWHMYSPLAEGNLWETFEREDDWLERTVLVVKMECLRHAGINLPQTTSLEEESRLVMKGMNEVDRLKKFARVGHIVLHQHREGVLHWDRKKGGLQNSCYYCPYIADDPGSRERGLMVGYTSILVASIVRAMAWSLVATGDPERGLVPGMKQAAILDHLHFLNGFGDERIFKGPKLPAPYHELFTTLTKARVAGWEYEGRRYLIAAPPLKPAGSSSETWSRIDGFIGRMLESGQNGCRTIDEQAEKIAVDIVRRGLQKVVEKHDLPKEQMPDTPQDTVWCPFEEHGKIRTAYSVEVDKFASIRRITMKYINDQAWTTPLSIAVFGQPGSGKSFTVRQILGTVNEDMVKRPLEFNLAQFDDPKDLEIAFHKVQDQTVAGETALVFFDEFDTNKLSWLRYFLAPMEDGKFKAGESTYEIGRAIFVFAGGVSTSWKHFYETRKTDGWEEFSKAKGPDFVSRLRGYLDIASINPPRETNSGPTRWVTSEVDGVLKFRRAILLRSLLEAHLADIIDSNSKEAGIDESVIHAFLNIKLYEHEARSMRAIIEMSRLSPRGFFQRSSLPSADQLKIHVDADEFVRHLGSHAMPRPATPSASKSSRTPANQSTKSGKRRSHSKKSQSSIRRARPKRRNSR
jgi:hypothetical protein